MRANRFRNASAPCAEFVANRLRLLTVVAGSKLIVVEQRRQRPRRYRPPPPGRIQAAEPKARIPAAAAST